MNELTKQLLIRCYNNEMLPGDASQNIMGDEEAIKQLCNETFNNGTVTTDKLEKFNAMLFEVADIVAQPDIEQVMNFICSYTKVGADVTIKEINVPEESKLAFQFTAVGSQPDFKRIENGTKLYSTPKYAQIGIYYEPMTKTNRCVEDFRKAVNDIAKAKVRLFVQQAMEIVQQGIASGNVPASQILDGTSTTLKNFKSVANKVSRRCGGGQVVFLADPELIDYYAMQQQNTTEYQLPESIKAETMKLHPTKVLDVECVNLINPYTTKTGNETYYPVNEGYLIGASAEKPLVITEFGGLERNGSVELIDGRVKTFARIGFDIVLLYGEAMGKVVESSVTL